jgi:hypothetical protein
LDWSATINCKTPIRKTKTPQTPARRLPDKPDELTELLPLIQAFCKKDRNYRIETDPWHLLCHQGGGFKRWQAQQDFPHRIVAVEFSALAGLAYLALAEQDTAQIPCFSPSHATKVAAWARKGHALLPDNIPLPAASPEFRRGLLALQNCKPSDLPKGTTAHGDPVRRWFLSRLLEEFYYSFALPPSLGVIRDIARLAWATIDDKTLRSFVEDQTMHLQAEHKANLRRERDNTSKTVAQVFINRATVQARTPNTDNPATAKAKALQKDQDILRQAQALFSQLTDESARRRMQSLLQAMQDEITDDMTDAPEPDDEDGYPEID